MPRIAAAGRYRVEVQPSSANVVAPRPRPHGHCNLRRVPSLGPFATVPVDCEALGLQITIADDGQAPSSFQVDLSQQSLEPLVKAMASKKRALVRGEGSISPLANVTLDDRSKKLAHVPLEAAFFAWASPVVGVGGVTGTHDLDLSNALLAFCTLGGFLYLDCACELVGATALFQGAGRHGGLYFDGPHPFDRSAIVEKLIADGRFSPPTIRGLTALGVSAFCWLNPSERFSDKPSPFSEDGSAWPHGAFVYKYDANRSLDCYFRVVDAPAHAATQIYECFRETRQLYAEFARRRRRYEEEWGLPPLKSEKPSKHEKPPPLTREKEKQRVHHLPALTHDQLPLAHHATCLDAHTHSHRTLLSPSSLPTLAARPRPRETLREISSQSSISLPSGGLRWRL